MDAHQPGGVSEITGGEAVAHRSAVVVRGLEPGSGPPVELGEALGHGRLRLEAEQIS